jgi:hypothetical protein
MLLLPATSNRLPARLLPLLAALYLPFIGGGFLTDDFAHIARLSRIDGVARLVDSPDTFGFYRPVPQASMAFDLAMHGQQAARFRAFNVLLHAAVIALAFLLARLVLGSSTAAGFAALAFALTPKAHPIAALWISARAELLMAAFAFASIAAWIVWTRGGRWIWLAAAGVAYALAIVSKETAMLLPLLLLLTPRTQRSWPTRIMAVGAMVMVAVVIYAWRAQTGALTPFSGDAHYDLASGAARWMRSLTNYTGRMIAAPLVLVLILASAKLIMGRRIAATPAGTPPALLTRYTIDVRMLAFALTWVLVFLAPVMPLAARAELYVYLPVFGLCLLAGWAADALSSSVDRRALVAAVVVYAGAFGTYQVVRSLEIHRTLVFSEELVAALRSSPELAGRDGRLTLVPADVRTERLLRDSIGGYLYVVLPLALGHGRIDGSVQYTGEPPPPGEWRLTCRDRDGEVVVSTP